jgi:hypothetical protein
VQAPTKALGFVRERKPPSRDSTTSGAGRFLDGFKASYET